SCSIKENVKPPSDLCNKRRIAGRNNYNFPSVVLKAAAVPAGSRNSSASTSAGRSNLAANRNRSASIHAGCSGEITNLTCNGVPRTMVDLINLHGFTLNDPQGRLKSMTGNKDKLDDFVQVKGGTVTFRGGDEFQLPDESQVVLRIPRKHDPYSFNLSDIQPEQHINCLLAKASLEEST
nr:ribonuclease H-like domain-containing protein [Tanacetum cinerariifolium]